MIQSTDLQPILIVDDADASREALKKKFADRCYRVFTADSVARACEILETISIDLVVIDLKIPEAGGFDLIKHIRENYKTTMVIMLTGFPSIERAVQAMKNGAEEYLAKPVTDEELFTAVRKALARQHTLQAGRCQPNLSEMAAFGLIGKSREMQQVYHAISKAAATSATLLITGESGTGKELVARAIHYSSSRASAPFMPINCGGIPEALLESELFGYIKGAFTGATETRAGFFLTADGGTIFLDEISETSLAMQVKLLRILQNQEVFMIGCRRPQKVDIRVMAATNKELSSLMKQGAFREDLYFRINVIVIDLPPLRKREDDIFLLINHFARKFAREAGVPVPKFSDHVLHVLKTYHWPGNIRELENVIQRLVVMTDDEFIDVPDLPDVMRFSAPKNSGLDRTLVEVEAEYIENVLAQVNGNKSRAAQVLGIDRKTLREKLKRHNLGNQ
ncbi:sigma-54-dependent Fis family transcriptional regulator [candidate division KSB1 bacterium]|nr:sigma-54-dependent Fis family transcriptional regulator [candidate division KSB1 bacterium]